MPPLNLSTLLNSVDELRDNSAASRDFRKALEKEGADYECFARWVAEALTSKGFQSRHALQDVVNALGRKAGFRVEYGPYERGDSSGLCFDGFWQCKSGNVFLVYNFTDEKPRTTVDEIGQTLARLNTKKQREAGVIIYAMLFVGNLPLEFFLNSIAREKLIGVATVASFDSLFELLARQQAMRLPFDFLERLLLPADAWRLDWRLALLDDWSQRLASSQESRPAPSAPPPPRPASLPGVPAPVPPPPPRPVARGGAAVEPARKVELRPGGAEASPAYEEGVARYEAGAADEALAIFVKVARARPDHADAHLMAGRILLGQERVAEALPFLRQAASLKPRDVPAALLAAQAQFRLGAFQAACAEYERGLGVDPNLVELRLGLGLTCLELGQVERARRELVLAQQLGPDKPEVFAALGRLYHRTGDHQRAIDAFVSGLSLDAENAEFYFQLGLIYDELGKSLESVEAYLNAIQLDPRQWRYHNNLGAAHFRANNWTEAIDAYKRALALNPNFAEAHSNLGDAFRSTGDRERAISCYQRALELKPQLQETRLTLAELLVEMNRGDQAVAIYEKLREGRPGDLSIVVPLVRLYNSTGRYDLAGRLCDEVLAADPSQIDIVILKGVTQNRSGDPTGAIALLENILPQNAENPHLLFNLGDCYMALHRVREAIEVYEEALKFDPTFIEANISLAKAYARDGKKALAILNFTKVLNLDPNNQEARQGLLQLG